MLEAMSYDLCLFKDQPGVDPRDVAENFLDSDEESEGPADPHFETLREKLAAALLAAGPLERLEYDYAEIADEDGITLEEAKERYRHIELDAPEGGSGVQITIYDEWCSITLPYWHTGDKAKAAIDEIWTYLDAARATAGYVCYDPQLEKLLEPSDREAVLETYEAVASEGGDE
jgi:hypothetical protein